MIAPTGRRGFLRGLVSLPLIGGGVTLIGAPSAVAEPVTLQLVERYAQWCSWEYREAWAEVHFLRAQNHIAELVAAGGRSFPDYPANAREDSRNGKWVPRDTPDLERIAMGAPPSTRAALVLSTVGCEWREGSR